MTGTYIGPEDIRVRFPNFDLLVEEMGEEKAMEYVRGGILEGDASQDTTIEKLKARMKDFARRTLQDTPDGCLFNDYSSVCPAPLTFAGIDPHAFPSRFWVKNKNMMDAFVVVRYIPILEITEPDATIRRITPIASMVDAMVVGVDFDYDISPIRINTAYIQELTDEETNERLRDSLSYNV